MAPVPKGQMARTRKRHRQRARETRNGTEGKEDRLVDSADDISTPGDPHEGGIRHKRRRRDDSEQSEMTAGAAVAAEQGDDDDGNSSDTDGQDQLSLMQQWGLPSSFGGGKLQRLPTAAAADPPTVTSPRDEPTNLALASRKRRRRAPFLSEHTMEVETFGSLDEFRKYLGMATHTKWTEAQEGEEDRDRDNDKSPTSDECDQANADDAPPMPPNEDKATDTASPSRALKKFHRQRYDLFHQFDEGIQIDEEGWWSVTPELIAAHTALALQGNHCASGVPDAIEPATDVDRECRPITPGLVWDAFAGVGGNAIQFALRGAQHVIATDTSRERLLAASHNAEIYGVRQYIDYIQADALTLTRFWRGAYATSDGRLEDILLEKSTADDAAAGGTLTAGASDRQQLAPSHPPPMFRAVFLSPPWGGPAYTRQSAYDLARMLPINLAALLEMVRELTDELVLYLPRTTDLCQLATYLLPADALRLEWHYLSDRLKVLIVHVHPQTASQDAGMESEREGGGQ